MNQIKHDIPLFLVGSLSLEVTGAGNVVNLCLYNIAMSVKPINVNRSSNELFSSAAVLNSPGQKENCIKVHFHLIPGC